MSEPDSPSSVDTEPSGLTAAATAPSASPSADAPPAPVQPTIAIGLPLNMAMPDGSPAQVPAGTDATALGEFLTSLLSSVYAGAAQGQGTAGVQSSGTAGAQGMNLVNVPMALPLLPGMNPVALPFLRAPGTGTAASSSAGSAGSSDSSSAGAGAGAGPGANPLLAMGGVNLPVLSNPLLLNMQFFQQLLGNQAAGRDAGNKKPGRGKKSKSAADEPDDQPESPGSSTNRKARKNVRERARRKELNDKHDELGSQLGTVKEERVEWRMRVRDIYEAAKRMEEERMKAHPQDVPTLDPQSAECKASVTAILGAQDPDPVDEYPPAAAKPDDDDDDLPNDTPKSRKQSAAALEMANRTAVLNGTAEILQWFQQLIRALRFARMAFSADPISVRVWNDRQVALQLLVEIGHGLYTAGRGSKKHESKRSGDVPPLSPSKDKDPFLVRALRKNAREQMRRLEVNNAFIRLARALSLPRDHKKLHLLVKALQSLRDFSASVREELEAMHSLFFPHANITIGSDHLAAASSSGWGAGAGGRSKAKDMDAPMATDQLSALADPPKVAGNKRGADDDKSAEGSEHKKRQRGGPAPASVSEDPTAHTDQHMAPGPAPGRTSKRNKGNADDFDA